MSNGAVVEDDKIVTKVIHSVPTTGNPTNISSVSWSADNNVVFITQKGIYIFDIQIHPDTKQTALQCTIHLIKPSECTNPHLSGNSIGLDTNLILNNDDSNRSALMLTLVDRTIVPHMEASVNSFRNYRVAKWSPPLGIDPKSLLVSLTNDNWLQLHHCSDRWSTFMDLSSLWLDYVKEKGWPYFQCSEDNTRGLQMLKDRTYLIGFREVCWSSRFKSFDESHSYCLLFSITCSGVLVIWKILEGYSSKEDVSIFLCISTGMQTVTALEWVSLSEEYGILMIGSMSGTIKLMKVTLAGMGDVHDLGLCWAEEDLLRVNMLEAIVMEEYPNMVIILGFKGSFLCAMAVSLRKDREMEVESVKTVQLGQYCASGVVKMENNELLISVLSEGLKKLSLSFDKGLKIRVTKIQHSRRYPKTLYHGLAASKNRSLWCVSETIGATYDHLILREPTVTTFFVFPDILINQVLSVLQMNQGSLGSYVDVLEAYRVLQGDNSIYSMPEVDILTANSYTLKFNRWLIMTRLVACSLGSTENGQLAERRNAIDMALQRRQCFDLMKKALNYNRKLDPGQAHAVGLTVSWVRKQFDNLSADERDLLSKAALWSGYDKDECQDVCPVCGDVYLITDPTFGYCSAGHKFPRCCFTLVLCSRIPYRRCQWCRAFACCEEEYPSGVKCIFCDGKFRIVQ